MPGFPYFGEHVKTHFVCLTCRKVVKGSQYGTSSCPTCGVQMADAGKTFKTPRRGNDREWTKIEQATRIVPRGKTDLRPTLKWINGVPRTLGAARRLQSTRLSRLTRRA